MAVIYSITNKINGKRYIGKTINPKTRWSAHKRNLRKEHRTKRAVSSYLFESVKRHGLNNFKFEILEEIENPTEKILSIKELWWIDSLKTCDRLYGYNMSRNSSTNCLVSEKTRKLMSETVKGKDNPNYGNYWTDEQKERMSKIAKDRHDSGKYYTEEWKRKIGKQVSVMWEDEERKQRMIAKLKIKKRKYFFDQYSREGEFIRRWDNVDEIISSHPDWKWQNIYSVCNGYKPTYRNFIWKKVLRND